MSSSTHTVLVALATVSLLVGGCGNLKRSDVGGACQHSHDCHSPLSCVYGVCRATCFDARDCPTGQSCILTSQGSVCQPPNQPLCDASTGCPGVLDAGSTDVIAPDRPKALADGGAGTGQAKFVGNIDTSRSIRPDFARYWNQFTPENAGKWGSVQRAGQDTFNWTSLDAMYKYCTDNNILFKQHNFIWGSQQPSWTASLTPETGPAAVQTWMTSFCQRYPGVQIIDVVNEPPPHSTPAYADAIGGGTGTTWNWIVNAFKWARQACPNAILVLNDFSNAEDASTAQDDIDIVNAIKAAGAPIDAVGCQLHDAVVSTSSTLKVNIDMIARATGLPVYITEFDIDTADDAEQERVMRDEFTMFWNNDNIKGITLWGYVVGHTWRSNTGLILDDGTMRPAMTWLMSFLGR